ncbi:GlsB/YeaQ/YmgE family stress response membrane protein [Rhodopila sp.]|uniref:GlsB/YeaQ/YmgE family stress response membrane protein n=1 Tax=Rhodopila sp. TaxID=2480087 RepID=UPI003D109A4B
MLGFVWAIIVGFVAGTVAKFIMPGRDPGGIIVTILLGIAGSVVATWLGRTLGWYHGNQGARFIGSIVGAVIILAIYRMFVRNRANYGGGPGGLGGPGGPSIT